MCVAACCSVLQCVAVCCCVLLCVAVCCCALLFVAVCCSVLPCVAVCCSVLWKNAADAGQGNITKTELERVLQCVAMCCSVLQCVAVCCGNIQLMPDRETYRKQSFQLKLLGYFIRGY